MRSNSEWSGVTGGWVGGKLNHNLVLVRVCVCVCLSLSCAVFVWVY